MLNYMFVYFPTASFLHRHSFVFQIPSVNRVKRPKYFYSPRPYSLEQIPEQHQASGMLPSSLSKPLSKLEFSVSKICHFCTSSF